MAAQANRLYCADSFPLFVETISELVRASGGVCQFSKIFWDVYRQADKANQHSLKLRQLRLLFQMIALNTQIGATAGEELCRLSDAEIDGRLRQSLRDASLG
jgi:hypothetical protein